MLQSLKGIGEILDITKTGSYTKTTYLGGHWVPLKETWRKTQQTHYKLHHRMVSRKTRLCKMSQITEDSQELPISLSGKTQQQHFRRIKFHCSHKQESELSSLCILVSTARLACCNHRLVKPYSLNNNNNNSLSFKSTEVRTTVRWT